jgi:hypothetical protein
MAGGVYTFFAKEVELAGMCGSVLLARSSGHDEEIL